jgi:Flp pilus assembly protein CpaB
LVVLVAALAAIGLAGVLWAERQLRRQRTIDHIDVKGA